MTARCEITQMPLGECAGACCRPDLKQYKPVAEVWMRVTEAAPTRPVVPTRHDIRANNIHALFQVVGGRRGKPDVVDMVRELCEPSSHREFYRPERGAKKSDRGQHRYHVTVTPPLLAQLYLSVAPLGSVEAGAVTPATSRPAARIDAIDTANRIDDEATRWLEQLDAVAVAPLDRIRKLGSLVPSLERCHRRHPFRNDAGTVTCCTAHQLEAALGRWWTWARVVTGWDMPAWQPDNTCPLCGVRGSIRVRVVEQLASCVNDACRESWDDTTIGLLADHIRHENREDEEAS